MKKTAILLLLLAVAACAEKKLWRNEMACFPMNPKENYSEIWFLKSCSDPFKAFIQWAEDTGRNWRNYEPSENETWLIFTLQH